MHPEWNGGDVERIAEGYAAGAASFVARLELREGERVLDVACGTGDLTLAAARAGALVTGVDVAPARVARARAHAFAERASARFLVARPESLPCRDESVDTSISMFGAMFAARPERAASELLRVTRGGGRIALASWTSRGFVGEMLDLIVAHVPQFAACRAALSWGDDATVAERLALARSVSCVRRRITFEYPSSPAETVELFRTFHGPTAHAFASVGDERRDALRRDLVAHWSDHNRAGLGETRVESEYLEVLALR